MQWSSRRLWLMTAMIVSDSNWICPTVRLQIYTFLSYNRERFKNYKLLFCLSTKSSAWRTHTHTQTHPHTHTHEVVFWSMHMLRLSTQMTVATSTSFSLIWIASLASSCDTPTPDWSTGTPTCCAAGHTHIQAKQSLIYDQGRVGRERHAGKRAFFSLSFFYPHSFSHARCALAGYKLTNAGCSDMSIKMGDSKFYYVPLFLD